MSAGGQPRQVSPWNVGHVFVQGPVRFLALAVLAQAFGDLRSWGRCDGAGGNWPHAAPRHDDAVSAAEFLGSPDCEFWADLADVPVRAVREQLANSLATARCAEGG